MYKSLLSVAAAATLAAFAGSGPTAAAEQFHGYGVNNDQSKAEEFTSQRRRWRRGRVIVRPYAWGPRRYYYYPGPYAYYGGYPYGAYAYPYGYGYYRPGISVGIGPFGFRAW